jgi:hypothetical protein
MPAAISGPLADMIVPVNTTIGVIAAHRPISERPGAARSIRSAAAASSSATDITAITIRPIRRALAEESARRMARPGTT